MRRDWNIFPIALALSLALHLAAAEVYVGYAWLRAALWAGPRPAAEELVIRLDDMGDPTGTGAASNSSPGRRPLEAREADEDQALLSRDPVGMGRIGQEPAQWTGPTGDGGAPAAQPLVAPSPPVTPPAVPAPTLPQTAPPVVMNLAPTPDLRVAPLSVAEKPPVVEAPLVVPPPDMHSEVVLAPHPKMSADSRQPGLPARSADPLPQNESDSDPFVRISGSAVFHDGRLDVRGGRAVKTVRPQLGIAGEIDVVALSYPKVVLEIHVAPTGDVDDAKVYRGSGSVAIDEPVRDAVWKWHFQPARDKTGKPISDVIFFTIEFR